MGFISMNFVKFFWYLFVSVLISTGNNNIITPGPNVKSSKGGVWPAPQIHTKYGQYYFVKVNKLKITSHQMTCPILSLAMERYATIIMSQFNSSYNGYKRWGWADRRKHRCTRQTDGVAQLKELRVNMEGKCETMPNIDMDESYELSIGMNFTANGAPLSILQSRSVWGALRGLETFSQLFYQLEACDNVLVNVTYIKDFPRFPHRGLMLDTSRHYISVSQLLYILDAMSYNKLNVFPWHIVDDQSFPYQSNHFPTLSKFGAYHPNLVYTIEDVKYVIEHARLRGIRILPEFDLPGHSRSWGEAFPIILTQCNKDEVVFLGPMDPSSNYTHQFLKQFFAEVSKVFPDTYIHYGGNEVDYKCWEENPFIRNYMTKNGIEHVDQLHYQLLLKLYRWNRKKIPIVWQDAVNLRAPSQPDAAVQIWKDISLQDVGVMMASGYHLIFSSCWNMDRTHMSWQKMYMCEPRDLLVKPELEELVLGGEACVWGEEVNTHNVLIRSFPRASIAAERLWSSYSLRNIEEASSRLEEQACRMNDRGIPTQPPNGPGFCV